MRIEELLKLSDYEWYEELILKDASKSMIEASMKCAIEVYETYKDLIKNTEWSDIIASFNVNLDINSEDTSLRQIARFDGTINTLTVNMHSVEHIKTCINDKGLDIYLNPESFMNVVLAHEFYHLVEMNTEGLYTYSKMDTSKILGFTIRKRNSIASEIGAYHFSKLASGMDISPRIFEKVFEIESIKES